MYFQSFSFLPGACRLLRAPKGKSAKFILSAGRLQAAARSKRQIRKIHPFSRAPAGCCALPTAFPKRPAV
jgi:hypothetical protein